MSFAPAGLSTILSISDDDIKIIFYSCRKQDHLINEWLEIVRKSTLVAAKNRILPEMQFGEHSFCYLRQ